MWQNAGKSGLDQWDWDMDPVGRNQVGFDLSTF